MAGMTGLRSTPASNLICVHGGCSWAKLSPKSPPRLQFLKLYRGRRLVAHFGSHGYRPGPTGVSRRKAVKPPSYNSDYDPVLDLDRIKSPSVRLLDEQQNMVGIVLKGKAVEMAKDAELILAILSADADPPVLRLFKCADYKKHKYESLKKKREQLKRTSANQMDTKELKMGYNIDSHDYFVRLKAAQKFLKDGDRVKIIVRLKGRENDFKDIAIELIKRFQNDIGEFANEESKSFSERNIYIVLTPNKVALQKVQEPSNVEETSATTVSATG